MWFTIIGMTCITFLNRFLFLAPGFSFKPGERFKRFLSFSSLAVLTAIWAPLVFQVEHASFTVTGFDYLIGTVVAAILSVMRVHSLLVVVLSVSVFFLIRFGLSA